MDSSEISKINLLNPLQIALSNSYLLIIIFLILLILILLVLWLIKKGLSNLLYLFCPFVLILSLVLILIFLPLSFQIQQIIAALIGGLFALIVTIFSQVSIDKNEL